MKRTPKQTATLIEIAVTEIRERMEYPLNKKQNRKIVREVCQKYALSPLHIRKIMGGWWNFTTPSRRGRKPVTTQ